MLKLTNVASSPSKRKYFRATLHNGDAEKTVISYNPNLHNIMENAQLADKPVRLLNFMEVSDEADSSSYIKLGDRSQAQYSPAVLPFEKVKPLIENCQVVSSVDQVMTRICVGEMVNMIVFVELSGSKVEEISTRYGIKKKKDVFIYDESCQENVRMTIWNNHITSFECSGVYSIRDIKVNSFNGKYLTTTASSVVKSSNTNIRRREIMKVDAKTIRLPADTLDVFEKAHFCKKCNRKAVPTGKFVQCESCHATSLLTTCDSRYNIRATFVTDDNKISLSISHAIAVKIASILEFDIDNMDDLQYALLSNTSIKLSYSSTHSVIDLEK